jgi:hypothetical protein
MAFMMVSPARLESPLLARPGAACSRPARTQAARVRAGRPPQRYTIGDVNLRQVEAIISSDDSSRRTFWLTVLCATCTFAISSDASRAAARPDSELISAFQEAFSAQGDFSVSVACGARRPTPSTPCRRPMMQPETTVSGSMRATSQPKNAP